MFWKKKDSRRSAAGGKDRQYDPKEYQAVLRCSICNGEQVAGFRHLADGRFEEVMLIRNAQDLQEFKERYGVETISKEY